VFTGLTLSRDSATGMYSYTTGGYWPADGLRGGVTNAQGHSSYFTTALSVRFLAANRITRNFTLMMRTEGLGAGKLIGTANIYAGKQRMQQACGPIAVPMQRSHSIVNICM